MKLELNIESFDKGLKALSKEYRIFAPKAFPKGELTQIQML